MKSYIPKLILGANLGILAFNLSGCASLLSQIFPSAPKEPNVRECGIISSEELTCRAALDPSYKQRFPMSLAVKEGWVCMPIDDYQKAKGYQVEVDGWVRTHCQCR